MRASNSGITALFCFGWIVLYAFLPVGWAFGLVSFAMNPVGPGLWFNFAFSAFLVHVILVSPIVHFVYPQMSSLLSAPGMRVARILLVLGLLLPPLSAFAYYLDGLKQLADLHEVLLVITLSVSMGALLYEATKKTWIFSLFVWGGIAFTFFIVNDVLNSMMTVWSYLSEGGWFYFWRIAVTVVGFMAFLFVYAMKCTQDTWKDRLHNWGLAFAVLGLYTASVKIVVPVVFAAFSGNTAVAPVVDFWWVLYLIAVFFCRMPSRLGYFLLSGLVVVRGITVLWEIVVGYMRMRSGVWELSHLANQLVVFGVMLWFGYVLLRPSTKKLFFKESPDTQ